MGRVAVLADVHGNLPALEAVLVEVARADVDRVVLAGDVVWGPFPSETLAVVQGLGDLVVAVRGNADREVATGTRIGIDWIDEITAWCADRLDAVERRLLGDWPTSVSLEVEGLGEVLVCHGSPRADDEPMAQATPLSRMQTLLVGVDAPFVVCGHTHAQFVRTVDAVTVVNPGSVGLPFGAAVAHWAILGPGIQLRRTSYDTGAAARAVASSECPHADWFVEQVVTPPAWATANDRFAGSA